MTTTAEVTAGRAEANAVVRRRHLDRLQDLGILLGVVVLIGIFTVIAPNFFSTGNLLNVLSGAVPVGLIAIGTTFVIISGSFDLSSGATFALSGVITAWVAIHADPATGIAAGLVAGIVAGIINGVLVGRLKLNSFLVTLATSLIFAGAALYVSNGFLLDVSEQAALVYVGTHDVFGIGFPIVLMLIAGLAIAAVLSSTTFGKYIYAVGGNREAARLVGIPVRTVQISVFAIGGLTAAIAGILQVATVGTAQANIGANLPLDAIAAVVIGGTSISGGRGSIARTAIGVIFIAILQNGFNLLSIQPFIQGIVQGLIIIAAVILNSLAGRD